MATTTPSKGLQNLPPVLVNTDQDLTAEPHLPSFRVPVVEVFAR
jgi:hypothetical protein